MLIDWFTVGAQAVNFLLLVWLMKHFFYRPVLKAIEAREHLIASQVDDAKAKDVSAQQHQDDLAHKLDDLEKQRSALMTKATGEAAAEGERLAAAARQVASSLVLKQGDDLRRQAREVGGAMAQKTVREVFAVARKTLVDLADASLDDRMCAVFSRRLRSLDANAKARLAPFLKTASDPAVVRSAFEVNVEQRASIQNAVNEIFSADVHLRFETAPDLVNGIELTSGGERAGWNISSYLTSLEQDVNTLLKPGEPAQPPEAHASPA